MHAQGLVLAQEWCREILLGNPNPGLESNQE